MNYTDYVKINNLVSDYIRELNDYKEELDALEKIAKLQSFDQQIEIISFEQKWIQERIEAAEHVRMETIFINAKFIGMFLHDKRKKLYDEFSEIRHDIDKFA